MRSLFFAAAIAVGLASAPAHADGFVDAQGRVNHSELTRECEHPPYATQLRGAALQANAEVSSRTLGDATRKVLNQVAGQSGLTGETALTGIARLEFAQSIVGGYASAAIEDVGRNYFCRINAIYQGNEETSDAIQEAEAYFYRAVTEAFNPVMYRDTDSSIALRDRKERELRDAARELPRAFDGISAISGTGNRAALDRYRFAYSASGGFSAQGALQVGGVDLASVGVCAGASYGSIVVIDSRVLNRLDFLRSNIALLLSGRGDSLNSYLIGLAQEIYANQAANTAAVMNAHQEICLRSVAQRVRDQIVAEAAARGHANANAPTNAAPTQDATTPAPDATTPAAGAATPAPNATTPTNPPAQQNQSQPQPQPSSGQL